MATPLRTALKRELEIDGKPWVVTITADGFRLVPKGKRKGRELAWRDLVGGDAALAVALNASLEREPRSTAPRRRSPAGPDDRAPLTRG